MAIRSDIKDRVQAQTDIVRLIGEHVALKAKGREFVGLCPFHDDKNPSMSVSPAKQIYKCFSCGAGGDVFTFVTQYHKMTFPEALRHLAQRLGIEVEETGRDDSGSRGDFRRIQEANAQACEFFRAMLKHAEHGKVARDYIDGRGISPEMVADFQIGYAPDRWDGLIEMARHKKWDHEALVKAELVLPRKNGPGHFDFFRHRLIFPICDALGRPIAFGGRKLRDEDDPKYLNSRETVAFNKSRTFYGLHLAKKAIHDTRMVVIVEGYTDVIACHQAAPAIPRNVVATLGTALTAEHVSELRRYAEKVVLVFDADEAGDRAADRAVELFLTGDVDVAIATIPRGPGGAKMDPAELLALEEGPELWNRAIGEARDALEHQFERVRLRLNNAAGMTARQRVAEEYLQQVGQMGIARAGAIRRNFVVQRLADLLHMKEDAVSELLRRSAPRRVTPPAVLNAPSVEAGQAGGENNASGDVAGPRSGHRLRAVQSAERQLIGCLIKDNRLFTEPLANGQALDEALPPEMLAEGPNRVLYGRLYDRLSQGETVTLAGLLADLAEDEQGDLAALATQCDADAEKLSEEETQATLFHKVAATLLAYHDEAQYRTQRERVIGQDADAAAAQARTLLEPLKAPKARIAIFRG